MVMDALVFRLCSFVTRRLVIIFISLTSYSKNPKHEGVASQRPQLNEDFFQVYIQ